MNRPELFFYLYILNPLLFFAHGLWRLREIGSLIPTGGYLRRAVIDGGLAGRRRIGLVVIHGIGTGEFLHDLFKYVSNEDVTIGSCVAIDLNPVFIKRSKKFYDVLVRYYGKKFDVEFFLMDALNTREYLDSLGITKADLIIGALPYTNMPDKVELWTDLYSRCAKTFSYYTYVNWIKRPLARPVAKLMLTSLGKKFNNVSQSNLIWANIPPGYAITASGRY